MLSGVFIDCAFHAESGWTGDLLKADRTDIEN